MQTKSFSDLASYVDTLPVISSHEHHLPDSMQQGMTLDRLLFHSYLSWYTVGGDGPSPFPDNKKKYYLPANHPGDDITLNRKAFLDFFRSNSYWIWLEKGIQKIYQIDESIAPDNWDEISAMIAGRYEDPAHQIRVLQETGGYLRAVQDSYWDYASDAGHPELFSPTMRTDMFIVSSHPSILDADQNSPFASYPDAPTDDFYDYLAFVRDLYIRWRNRGAVAMKCAVAYERPISFNNVSAKRAQAVFGKPADQLDPQDRFDYGDFMFHWFCELSQELDVPYQIHTGLARLSGSNPILLVPVIERHPECQFVLFHAGFPWVMEIAGIAHNYRNAIIDMVWMPIISTTAAISALDTYLDVTTCDVIGWGGDTWTSEEAVGATLAWKYVITSVLAKRVERGFLNFREAQELAEKLLFRNNAEIYQLKHLID